MDMWAGSMDQGSHEEADTRDLVHLFHALQRREKFTYFFTMFRHQTFDVEAIGGAF